MRVLLTGGAGYIGSHTAKLFSAKGYDLLCVDNYSTGFESLAKYGKHLRGDLLDLPFLERTVKDFRPEGVVHFAAKALVGESVERPLDYYQTNVGGTQNLLRALDQLPQLPVFVFSSTCSVYGITDQSLSEDFPTAPMNPYAKTKFFMEEMLRDYCHSRKGSAVSLRYFNASGADSGGELGELHDPETHLIPKLLLNLIDPVKYPVTIFGTDYPTTDGTCVRDYIHVEDLAHAHLSALKFAQGRKGVEIFNLGTGQGHSVKEVIAKVEEVTGKKVKVSMGQRREGDPPRLVARAEKAEKLLSWKPIHNLDSIVRTAWEFTRKRRS